MPSRLSKIIELQITPQVKELPPTTVLDSIFMTSDLRAEPFFTIIFTAFNIKDRPAAYLF